MVGSWWLGVPKTGIGIVSYMVYGLWMKDVASPVRLYRRSVFDRLPLQSHTEFADIEILAKANFIEKIFDEVSIDWKNLKPGTPEHPTEEQQLADSTKPAADSSAAATETKPAG